MDLDACYQFTLCWHFFAKYTLLIFIINFSFKMWITFVLRKNHLKWIIFIENSTDRKICKFISFSITLGWIISLFYVNIVFLPHRQKQSVSNFFFICIYFLWLWEKSNLCKIWANRKKNIQFHIISIKLNIFYYMSDL